MARARKACATHGCANTVSGGTSRCPDCASRADQVRGTAAQRGYKSRGHRRFRRLVLDRDRLCVLCRTRGVLRIATVADHWPTSRRDLEAQGLDPNDPRCGRGLCGPCHSRETAEHQPGGWNA